MQRPLLGARECSNAHHPQTPHEVVAVEYFYTVDLGELHGRKMERLAEKAGFDDVEAFAALLLAYAVDQAGAWDRETLKRTIRQSREVSARAIERLIFGTPDDTRGQ